MPTNPGAPPGFDRERRRRAVGRVAARLRQEPDDVSEMLPFDDVVDALGRRSQVDLGIQTIPLDSVVGTVGRRRAEFDRAFRPATRRLRERWQRIATARRRGEEMPPIDVYRVGDLYFVEDGHHRMSVARALGDTVIEARVREVRTSLPATHELTTGQLDLKRHERIFHERVPLPPAARAQIRLTDEWRYAELALQVEARGYRESQAKGRLISREELARTWFYETYQPIVEILREAGVGGPGTDTDRYLRFVLLRYLLLHTTEWTDEVIEELLSRLRRPAAEDDTLVHQLFKEMQ